MDPTIKVLTAALAYADALIENGPAVYAIAGVNAVLALFPDFPDSWCADAMKGHPEKLQGRRDELQQALARVG
jgi:hypothetical protein